MAVTGNTGAASGSAAGEEVEGTGQEVKGQETEKQDTKGLEVKQEAKKDIVVQGTGGVLHEYQQKADELPKVQSCIKRHNLLTGCTCLASAPESSFVIRQ